MIKPGKEDQKTSLSEYEGGTIRSKMESIRFGLVVLYS